MKCDICNQDASVYLTQIINGQMTTVNLCEGCSKEKGVTDTTGFGLAEAFIGPASARVDELTCPACGFTQAQLKKIGRMGCPECYTTFRDGLEGLLYAMHTGTSHVGKVPGGTASYTPLAFKPVQSPKSPAVSPVKATKSIQALRAELQDAVAEERFEDAARIKTEITKLEQASQSDT
jgi:protein arginine kinase activator